MKFLTWEEVDEFVDIVTIRYASRNLSGVYGVPRGGSVLAVMLSHGLNIPYLASPCENCMVVDDISDSGLTLQQYRKKGYEIVTMYCHPETKVIPHFYKNLKGDEWIVFPWEREIPHESVVSPSSNIKKQE